MLAPALKLEIRGTTKIRDKIANAKKRIGDFMFRKLRSKLNFWNLNPTIKGFDLSTFVRLMVAAIEAITIN